MESFVKLTDVCDFQGGTQPPKSLWKKDLEDGYIRMLQIRDFTQRGKDNVEYIPYKKTLKTCEEHDILIGRYGASVGKICTGLSGAYNVALVKTKPNLDKIRRDFLLHLLRGTIFQNFILNVGDRAAQAGFNKGDLEGFEFSLPPLDQQKKIAAILDAADAYRQKTKALIEKYDELTQSLFLDMFGDPMRNPKEWMEKSLGESVEIITYGLTVRPAYKKEGFPVISAKEIKSGEVNFNDAKLIAKDDFDKVANKGKPEINEVLFTKTGAGIGQCAVIKVSENFAITQNIARIKFKKSIDVTYILFYLRTPYIQRLSHRESKGNAIKDLQLGDMKKFKILLPPIELQNQFSERVQVIESQKKQAQASLAQAEDLFNSLLQRAFKGELS